MTQLIACLEKISRVLNRFMMFIAGMSLVTMMALACANVMFRSFGMPIKGTFELMGLFGAVVAAFALAATQMQHQHIAVDVVVRLFPARVRRILLILNYLIGSAFFLLAAWQTIALGTNLWNVHELSETLRIAYFPFVYSVSMGCVMISMVIIIELLKEIVREGEGR